MNIAKLIVIALVCVVVSGLVAFFVSSGTRDTAGKISRTQEQGAELDGVMDMLNRLDRRLEALENRPETGHEKTAAVLEERIHNAEKEMAEIRRNMRDADSEKVPAASGTIIESGADNNRIAEDVIAEIEKNPKRIMDSMRKQMLKKAHNPMDALASLELDAEQTKQAQKILNESIDKYMDLNNKRDKMTPEEFQEEKRKLTEARKDAFRRILNPVQYEKYEEMEKRMEEMEHQSESTMPRPGPTEGMNDGVNSSGR